MLSSTRIPLRRAACFPTSEWAGATRESLGHGTVHKGGSLQPTPVDYPRPDCVSHHVQPLCSQQFRLTPGWRKRWRGGLRVSFAHPSPFRTRKGDWISLGSSPLYHYRGIRNKKCKRQIATGTGARSGFHRFWSSFVETASPGIREISTWTPLHILRGPREGKTSPKIFVICHFSFGGQPSRRLPPVVSWRPTGGAIWSAAAAARSAAYLGG